MDWPVSGHSTDNDMKESMHLTSTAIDFGRIDNWAGYANFQHGEILPEAEAQFIVSLFNCTCVQQPANHITARNASKLSYSVHDDIRYVCFSIVDMLLFMAEKKHSHGPHNATERRVCL